MSLKVTMAVSGLLFTLGSQALAADYDVLRPAVEESIRDVAAMSQFLQSSGASSGGVGGGGVGGGGFPRNPAGGGDCQFCDEDQEVAVVDEGDVNMALGIMQEVAGSLNQAMFHILKLPTASGQDYNFNKAFACSYTGDAAIDIGSASLALGFPGNNHPQWRNKESSSVNRLTRGRSLAGCP